MNYWIFQGKPEAYRFKDSIKNDLLKEWNVQKHIPHIKKGDKAIIWITGENGGCYGLADVLTDPEILGKSEDREHWIPKDETGRKHQKEDPIVHKVKIMLTHNLFDMPILKNKIPVSNGMLEKIKKGIRGTNFASDKKDYNMIQSLIESN